jgi:SAM-dependent methyltransferase
MTPESISEEIRAIRQRIEAQYPSVRRDGDGPHRATGQSATGRLAAGQPGTGEGQGPDATVFPSEPLPIADLLPLFHARDAAEGKVAAIGKVNPRPGGAVNAIIQRAKRLIARSLQWFVRDQVDFNFATVRAVSEAMEALNEVNRSLVVASNRMARLEQQTNGLQQDFARVEDVRAEADVHLREATDTLSAQTRSLEVALRQLIAAEHEFATGKIASLAERQEQAVNDQENAIKSLGARFDEHMRAREREDIRLLRTLADVQNAFMQRLAKAEAEWKLVLDRRISETDERSRAALHQALAESRARLDFLVHEEVRLLRQRVGAIFADPSRAGVSGDDDRGRAVAQVLSRDPDYLDDVRFADRFRGPLDSVKEKLSVHVGAFRGQGPVFDLGCGRGEFLRLLRDEGIEATGVDSNPELVRMVRGAGLQAVEDDLLHFLEGQPPDAAGGIFCSHVIEHLPPAVLIRMVSLAHRVLRPGGVVVIETPNPACLAIFATYFYLDPTHLRPVPSEYLAYLLEENGFTDVLVRPLHPAEDAFSALKPLPDSFRQQFFGSLDYAIQARKPVLAGATDPD